MPLCPYPPSGSPTPADRITPDQRGPLRAIKHNECTVGTWQRVGPKHYLDRARYALTTNLKALQAPADEAPAVPRITGEKPPGWDGE